MSTRGRKGRGRGRGSSKKSQNASAEKALAVLNDESTTDSLPKALNDIVREVAKPKEKSKNVQSDEKINEATSPGVDDLENVTTNSVCESITIEDDSKPDIKSEEEKSFLCMKENETDLNKTNVDNMASLDSKISNIPSVSLSNEPILEANVIENESGNESDTKCGDTINNKDNKEGDNINHDSEYTKSGVNTSTFANTDKNNRPPLICVEDDENSHGDPIHQDSSIKNSYMKNSSLRNSPKNDSPMKKSSINNSPTKEPVLENETVVKKTSQKISRVFLKPLASETTSEDIKEFFEAHGLSANDSYVPYKNGFSKGYGFAGFNDQEEAKKALLLSGAQIKGMKVEITMAIEKDTLTDVKPTKILFLRNLPNTCTESSLKDLMNDCIEIRLLTNGSDGSHRGIAFIEFETSEKAAEMKKELRSLVIDGKRIGIEYGQPKNYNNNRNDTNFRNYNNHYINNNYHNNSYDQGRKRPNYYQDGHRDRFNYNNGPHYNNNSGRNQFSNRSYNFQQNRAPPAADLDYGSHFPRQEGHIPYSHNNQHSQNNNLNNQHSQNRYLHNNYSHNRQGGFFRPPFEGHRNPSYYEQPPPCGSYNYRPSSHLAPPPMFPPHSDRRRGHQGGSGRF